jgi:hypothetical protein
LAGNKAGQGILKKKLRQILLFSRLVGPWPMELSIKHGWEIDGVGFCGSIDVTPFDLSECRYPIAPESVTGRLQDRHLGAQLDQWIACGQQVTPLVGGRRYRFAWVDRNSCEFSLVAATSCS